MNVTLPLTETREDPKSIGIVCTCGKACGSPFVGIVRCKCGAVWSLSAMRLSVGRRYHAGTHE